MPGTMAAVLLVSLLLLLKSCTAAESGLEVPVDASESIIDAETFVRQEAQVVQAITDLDSQLENLLQQISSSSGSTEIDVEIDEVDDNGSEQFLSEMIVAFPSSKLTKEEQNRLKQEIETDVAETLDKVIVSDLIEPNVEQDVSGGLVESDFAVTGSMNKVERLFREEEQATDELKRMQAELDAALDTLPANGGPTEIDIVVSDTDGSHGNIDEEIVVEIAPGTGSGPRLTDAERAAVEQEIVEEVADAVGAIILNDFVDTAAPTVAEHDDVHLKVNPLLDSSPTSSPLPIARAVAEAIDEEVHPTWRKPQLSGLRGGYDYPMFYPPHWQMAPDDQLWTMRLSMLTSISCMALLLIMAVWSQVRRSRRRAAIDDSEFRWAEAVEYMDAFPYDP